MKKVISIYGLPASGKTTQAEKLNQEFGWIQFGMGDRLREEIASGSELGKEIEKSVSAGVLIPDELMIQIIKNLGPQIKEHGIIFDGFPRMYSQTLMSEEILKEIDMEFDKFFLLEVSAEEALRRIEARSATSGRADDKDADAIKNRMGVFERESKILIDYYQKIGKLVIINGELSIDEVYEEIKKHL